MLVAVVVGFLKFYIFEIDRHVTDVVVGAVCFFRCFNLCFCAYFKTRTVSNWVWILIVLTK